MRRFRWRGVQLFDSIPNIMKRWAILTVFLYALALIFLTLPTVFIAFANWGLKESDMGIRGALDIYAQWGYWVWLAVLVAGQALLLLLPLNIAERRLPARRPLKVPVIVSGYLALPPAIDSGGGQEGRGRWRRWRSLADAGLERRHSQVCKDAARAAHGGDSEPERAASGYANAAGPAGIEAPANEFQHALG